jgi:TatD DNase family protein
MLVDSHCHLDLIAPAPGSVQDLLAGARAAGVGHVLCVAVNRANAPVVREIARTHAGVSASAGVHPNETGEPMPGVDELIPLADHPEVVALGETGLDYYRTDPAAAAHQRDGLRAHVRAARALRKPLIIHMRDATEDTLAILREERAGEVGGVMHCFTEDADTALRAVELGFHVSFSGIVTFRNADKVRAAARAVPEERLLVETDAPWLAPVPHRGAINQPAWVAHVAACVATLRHTDPAALAALTTRNFARLFRVPVPFA